MKKEKENTVNLIEIDVSDFDEEQVLTIVTKVMEQIDKLDSKEKCNEKKEKHKCCGKCEGCKSNKEDIEEMTNKIVAKKAMEMDCRVSLRNVIKIADHYKLTKQIGKYREELIELLHEVDKLANGKGDISNLTEEMADVLFMSSQIQYLLGIKGKEIGDVIEFKANRTLEQIKNEEKEKEKHE